MSSRLQYRMHACVRCGRRFARAENLKKHLAKKKPCLPIMGNQDTYTPSWDPIADSIPRYNGLQCPFCMKTLSSLSNRDRHMRHYCEHAKIVFVKRAIDEKTEQQKQKIVDYLKSLDPNTKVCDILNGQNIITNRGYG